MCYAHLATLGNSPLPISSSSATWTAFLLAERKDDGAFAFGRFENLCVGLGFRV